MQSSNPDQGPTVVLRVRIQASKRFPVRELTVTFFSGFESQSGNKLCSMTQKHIPGGARRTQVLLTRSAAFIDGSSSNKFLNRVKNLTTTQQHKSLSLKELPMLLSSPGQSRGTAVMTDLRFPDCTQRPHVTSRKAVVMATQGTEPAVRPTPTKLLKLLKSSHMSGRLFFFLRLFDVIDTSAHVWCSL